jgi:spore maturation protein CgeB
MRIVIFGLTVSSAWGNGHATLWRSLINALAKEGHEVTFFEKDVAYYRTRRDLAQLPHPCTLRLYPSWNEVRADARRAADAADCAIITSYCPDGRTACTAVLESRARVRVFYDLDTPVTLKQLDAGEDVPYLPVGGLGAFDLVLSFTGGRALDRLRTQLGARNVAALYGSVDPATHRPVAPDPHWAAACSYLGTWSSDRQRALEMLFVEPARQHPEKLFVVGGSLYPQELGWPRNVSHHEHVPPPSHPAFYCSSPLTISVTRGVMAELGYCPSGRLFEAAACGIPVLSDWFEGLDSFFTPGEEILIGHTTGDAVAALRRTDLARIGARARQRALAHHSGTRRAAELVSLIGGAA